MDVKTVIRMESEKLAQCLIMQFLDSNKRIDATHRDDFEVALECLKNLWGIDKFDVTVPGIRSLVDLIPPPKYDTEHAMTLKEEGNAALKNGNFDLAIEKYTEAIKEDPTQAAFYCNRAAAYSRKEEYSKSIPDCEEAIRLNPTYTTAYSRLGLAYNKLNKKTEAREAYLQGINMCPNNECLKNNLAAMESTKDEPPPSLQSPSQTLNENSFFDVLNNCTKDPNMAARLHEKLNGQEVQFLLQDPEMSQFYQRINSNPTAIFKLMSDPRMTRLMQAVMGK